MSVVMRRWKRPENVPVPTVWSRFEGKRPINGVLPKFWIQDIPEDQDEVVAEIMVKCFLNDEPLSRFCSKIIVVKFSDNHSYMDRILDIGFDKDATDFMFKMWVDVLKDRLGLICYMENPDPTGKPIIAGVNCTHLVHKDDLISEGPQVDKCEIIFGVLDYVSKIENVYKMFGIDEYMGAMGLYVSPEFRGQNLGIELLKARIPLGRAVGIKMTFTVFTATASQIIADRIGYQNLVSIPYKELEQREPKFKFPGIQSHTENITYKYMKF